MKNSLSAIAVESCPDGGICGIDCDCSTGVPTDDPNDTPPPPPPPISSPFALDNTGKDEETSERELSEQVPIQHTQPDGNTEDREFRYSTPRSFKKQDRRSVNLWVVLHGRSQDSQRMHKFFKEIPHRNRTALVYPEALYIKTDNSLNAHSNNDQDKRWRQPRRPDQVSDRDAFRDVVFIEWLVSQLLENNPQLHPDRLYVTGFSSGAGLPLRALELFWDTLTPTRVDLVELTDLLGPAPLIITSTDNRQRRKAPTSG